MASTYQTLANLFSEIRDIAGKDSTTLADSTLLRYANKRYLEMIRHLVSLNEDLYAQIASTDLVANQREYPLPVDDTTGSAALPYGGGMIKLQRVEITYDNTNWRVMNPMSLQEFGSPTITDTDLNAQVVKTSPRYWFKDRSLWIAPVPSSSDYTTVGNANLRIYWIERPAELGATSTIPDMPKDFLGLLGEGILIDVFRMFDRTSDSRDAKQNWSLGLAEMKQFEQAPDAEQPYIFRASKKKYN